ncbi:obtusifoliol 14-alpha demethylase [Selaginella moellendorffii]|nr:obtusifoliol 14-alpha demethylase [Selaginella moellendorffii]|eukprot:XP_002982721.2 obtusifoliol 14-alpha demethylase [Selaginella moellendorffii]
MEVKAMEADRSTVAAALLLLVGTTCCLWLLSWWRSSSGGSRNRNRLPPVVDSVPIVGGLLKFVKGPIVMLRQEYQRLGSVFTVNIVTRKITFLIGPDVSSHFYKAQESELSQKEVYQFNVPTFGPGVVFDVDYSVRMEQFRFFTEALKVSRLKTYVDYMVEEAQLFFSKWGDEGEVDLKEELERLIILTASRCLLGSEVRNQLFEDVSNLFHDLDNGMQPISVLFPYLPIPAHRRRDRARKELASVFAKIIGNRKISGRSEMDMLQVFIDSKYRATGRSTTEDEITGLLIAALFAGQHTSSITSTWTGAYLLTYKNYWDSAVEEQRNVMAKIGDKLDYDIVSEMDVLHRCMKEALRLHPPLIMLMRYCHKDFSVTTRDGVEYNIPAGHIVATSPAFANRLPHVFKDPDSFDPERFAPGREEDKAVPFSYTSFGGGRHGCLGETFGYMQVKTVWSILLRNFEMELVSPFPEIDWNAMVVGPKGKVMVRYKRKLLA